MRLRVVQICTTHTRGAWPRTVEVLMRVTGMIGGTSIRLSFSTYSMCIRRSGHVHTKRSPLRSSCLMMPCTSSQRIASASSLFGSGVPALVSSGEYVLSQCYAAPKSKLSLAVINSPLRSMNERQICELDTALMAASSESLFTMVAQKCRRQNASQLGRVPP